MAEYIKREALVHRLKSPYLFNITQRIFEIISEIPAADVSPGVRCKECAEFQQKGEYYNGTPFGYCYHWDYEEGSSPNEVDGNDFCSYGKRREDA